MAAMQAQMGGAPPGAAPSPGVLPKPPAAFPGALPGLGSGKLPGLGGSKLPGLGGALPGKKK